LLSPALRAGHFEMIVDRLRSLLDAGKQAVASEPLERRVDPRRKVSLKAEILPVSDYADIKIVNASRTGFGGETAVSLEAKRPLIFSVEKNQFHQGSVRWAKGKKFGVDLEDALGILGYSSDVDTGFLTRHAPRPRRYPVDLAGRVVVESSFRRATVRDISQSGMRLEVEAKLDVGQHVLIRLPDRPLILAFVRWQANQMVGVETAERMQTLRLVYASE